MSDIIVVLGSWGSGTSAAIGALELMGCNICPPHFMTNDPRTPNSFEPLSLRSIIVPNFNEPGLHFSGPDRGAVPGYFKEWLAKEKQKSDKPLAVKLPHLCFFIPDMIEAWNPVFIMIERPFDQIEASRFRRRWPIHLGAIGAKACYETANHDLEALKLDCLRIKYVDLTEDAEATIDKFADWTGLKPDVETRAAAIKWLAR